MNKPCSGLYRNEQIVVQIYEYSDGAWTIDLHGHDIENGFHRFAVPVRSGKGAMDQRTRETITQHCAMVISSVLSLTGSGYPF